MTSFWLSKSKVCELTGWSPRYVEMKAASGEIAVRDCAERARNGRIAKEYAAASLPIEARNKLVGRAELVGQAKTTAATTAPLFADHSPAVKNQRIKLNPEAEREATARLEILRPLLDFIQDPANRARFSTLTLADGRAVTSSDLMSTYLSQA